MERSLALAKKYKHLTNSESGESNLDSRSAMELNIHSTEKSKSGAIESLLSQNDDLAARLKVLLRRLASIEGENLKLIQEHREMKNQLTGITDQVSVTREKESSWRERTLAAEESMTMQQSQMRQKEIEFAKLRTQEWEMRQQLQTRLEETEKGFHRLLRYRARIKNWAHPAFKRVLTVLAEKSLRMEHFKRELQKTEVQCQNLIFKNLEVVKKSKEALRSLEEEKIRLISHFEKERQDFQNEIANFGETSEELRKKAALLEKSLERQDYLDNRLIFAERQNQELRSKFNEDYSQLQNQMYEWRTKAQGLQAEHDNLIDQKNEFEYKYLNAKELSERLEEQMESLRLVWKEKVQENERLRHNQQALESLNSELSVKLNELRNQATLFNGTQP